jgi:hypothetical protein
MPGSPLYAGVKEWFRERFSTDDDSLEQNTSDIDKPE